ncbi:MAG TPA: sterol desaturase family protein [Actinomycetota bacterium]|nr:sterol desaturase family protein [Actinomycetota bacterium]
MRTEPSATAPSATQATTLAEEARFFWSHRNARLISGAFAAALALRVALGGWTRWDIVVVAALIAAEPFVEWMIHVFILHFKPRKIFGRYVDPLVSRKHRAHHSDPRKVEWIFVPMPVLTRAVPVILLLYILLFPTFRLGVTASATGLGILLTYEWTHYLIHSRYQPRSRLYRYVWRAHRLHHYKNEKYWFGVTVHAADHVLGTFPAKDAVETSPTCRTLGAEQATL